MPHCPLATSHSPCGWTEERGQHPRGPRWPDRPREGLHSEGLFLNGGCRGGRTEPLPPVLRSHASRHAGVHGSGRPQLETLQVNVVRPRRSVQSLNSWPTPRQIQHTARTRWAAVVPPLGPWVMPLREGD